MYSCPLNNTNLNCTCPLICRFLSTNTQLALCTPWIRPKADPKYCFRSAGGNLWMREQTVHIVLHDFIKGTWASVDFGNHRGSWNQSPGYWGTTVVKFGESQKYAWFFDCVGGPCPPIPLLFKGQLYSDVSFSFVLFHVSLSRLDLPWELTSLQVFKAKI